MYNKMEKPVFTFVANENFTYSEVGLKGEKRYFVEGYASTIDEDKSGEIISPGAQDDLVSQMQNETITMDVEHEEWYDDKGNLLTRPKNEKIPVAKIVSVKRMPTGTWIKAELNKNLKSFGELWGSIKDGFLKAFSIAYYPTKRTGNIIDKLNLINVTLTGSPVNSQATFTASMKSAVAYMKALENPADTPEMPELDKPDTPKSPAIKNTEEKMAEDKNEKKEFKCKKCDKEFESQELLDKHMESHSEDTKKPEAETKSEEEVEDKKKEDKPAVKSETETALEAEVKALKEDKIKLEAALKAEQEKPVMKSIVDRVEKTPPMETKIVQPLQLIG